MSRVACIRWISHVATTSIGEPAALRTDLKAFVARLRELVCIVTWLMLIYVTQSVTPRYRIGEDIVEGTETWATEGSGRR